MYNDLGALLALEEALRLPDSDLRQAVERVVTEWEDSLAKQASEMEAMDNGTYA